MVILVAGLTSCSDDDDNGGSGSSTITVDKVFLQNVKDEVNPDREVTFARQGQLLRIQGSGFKGLRHIYVNGYDTYFNNALMTDNNVWVTINTKTPITDAAEDVRNTIQFVKDNTSFTYEFEIRAASPSITSFFNSLPQPGEKVIVYGTNLHETTQVTLPGGTVITDGIESDADGEWFSFTMPEGETAGGSLTSEGANGTAKSPAYFNDNSCYIINYDGLGTLGSWSATYGSDQLADDPLNSGRGKCIMLVPQSVLNDGGQLKGTIGKPWATAGNDDNANEDWTRMTTSGLLTAETTVDKIALQFDIYCPEPWQGSGQLQIALQNNQSTFGWGCGDSQKDTSGQYIRQATVWVPWLNTTDGTTTPFTTDGKWKTVTIPLTDFGQYSDFGKNGVSYTFQNVIDDKNAGSYKNVMLYFVNQDITLKFSDESEKVISSSDFKQKIYIDNLRLVNTETFTVSDFPDSDTSEQ